MKERFLAAPKLYIGDGLPEENSEFMPEVGEFLIPELPLYGEDFMGSNFISCSSGKLCDIAAVVDAAGELQGICDALTKEMPGVPEDFLEDCVVDIAAACALLPEGTLVKVEIKGFSAAIQALPTSQIYQLWKRKNPADYK